MNKARFRGYEKTYTDIFPKAKQTNRYARLRSRHRNIDCYRLKIRTLPRTVCHTPIACCEWCREKLGEMRVADF